MIKAIKASKHNYNLFGPVNTFGVKPPYTYLCSLPIIIFTTGGSIYQRAIQAINRNNRSPLPFQLFV
jgi:hypothetical protein